MDQDTINKKMIESEQKKRDYEGRIFASEDERRDIEERVRTGKYKIIPKTLSGGYVRAGPNTVGVVSGPGREIEWVNRGDPDFNQIEDDIYRHTDSEGDPIYDNEEHKAEYQRQIDEIYMKAKE